MRLKGCALGGCTPPTEARPTERPLDSVQVPPLQPRPASAPAERRSLGGWNLGDGWGGFGDFFWEKNQVGWTWTLVPNYTKYNMFLKICIFLFKIIFIFVFFFWEGVGGWVIFSMFFPFFFLGGGGAGIKQMFVSGNVDVEIMDILQWKNFPFQGVVSFWSSCLGRGFKYCLFSTVPGEMMKFD